MSDQQQTSPPKMREMTPAQILRREYLRVLITTKITDAEILAVNRRLATTSTAFEHVLVALLDAYAKGHVKVHTSDHGDIRYDTSGVQNQFVK